MEITGKAAMPVAADVITPINISLTSH